MNKVYPSAAAALKGIVHDGQLMAVGGFGLCGIPEALIEGLTSKQIGKRLAISPRTVDVYRGRLMKKYDSATTPLLVQKLLSA